MGVKVILNLKKKGKKEGSLSPEKKDKRLVILSLEKKGLRLVILVLEKKRRRLNCLNIIKRDCGDNGYMKVATQKANQMPVSERVQEYRKVSPHPRQHQGIVVMTFRCKHQL